MLKKQFILIIIVCIFFAAACSTQQKIVYDFPAAMTPEIKSGYLKICEQGRVLYEKNCARCHTTILKGKKIIPDFTEEKMSGYAIRVSNKKHEDNLPDSLVTAEELGYIANFFAYKKKNNSR